jgi:hypothetical protein
METQQRGPQQAKAMAVMRATHISSMSPSFVPVPMKALEKGTDQAGLFLTPWLAAYPLPRL